MFSGLGDLHQVGVERKRQVVEVQQPQRRAEVLRAQLGRFGRGRVFHGADRRAAPAAPGWRSSASANAPTALPLSGL